MPTNCGCGCECGSFSFSNTGNINGSTFQIGNIDSCQDVETTYHKLLPKVEELKSNVDNAGFSAEQKSEIIEIIQQLENEVKNKKRPNIFKGLLYALASAAMVVNQCTSIAGIIPIIKSTLGL